MFKIHDRRITANEPYEYLPVTASEVYEVGEALVMTGGKATKCGATAKPTHICMGVSDGETVPAIPVLATTRFEVEYTAKPTAGTVVTLHTDGLQVTATTSSGVFAVEFVDEANQTVIGCFR